MSEQEFNVTTQIKASRDEVWTALTDPEVIRDWHGWDFDGLTEEIEFIYVQHAKRFPPDRIELEPDQTVTLDSQDGVTSLTIVREGEPGTDYDVIEEGWIAFFQQLRYLLERRPSYRRHTAYLEAVAAPSKVAVALSEKGSPWHESTRQRGLEIEGGLVVLMSEQPIESGATGSITAVVSLFGDDVSLDEWEQWWQATTAG